MQLQLKAPSRDAWLDTVMEDFDRFLLDHASCEKKASGMAMSMISHYPDKPRLLRDMLNLAVEEMSHFRDVVRLILEQGLTPGADLKDDYINSLHKLMDQGKDVYLLDRLLIGAIVEARGAERFGMIAGALPAGKLQRFYQGITDSEARHYRLFLDLALAYFPAQQVEPRLEQLLLGETEILEQLPLKPRLH